MDCRRFGTDCKIQRTLKGATKIEECIVVKAKFVNPKAFWFTEGGTYVLQKSPHLSSNLMVIDDDGESWYTTEQLDGTWEVVGTHTHAVFERVEE